MFIASALAFAQTESIFYDFQGVLLVLDFSDKNT